MSSSSSLKPVSSKMIVFFNNPLIRHWEADMVALEGPLLPALDAEDFHPLQSILMRQERPIREMKPSSKHTFLLC